VATHAEETRQAIGSGFVECLAHTVDCVDLLGSHHVVAETLHVDEIGLIDLQIGEVLPELRERSLAVGLTTPRGNEHLGSALIEHLPEVDLGIAIPTTAGPGVDVRDARVDALMVERDSVSFGSMA
jgi:hypothetical protein